MTNFKDVTGMVFSRLTVIKFTHTNKSGKCCFDCICECGKVVNVSGKNLRNGNTRSCGCLAIEVRRSAKTHGYCRKETKPEHDTYRSMIERCTWPHHKYFYNYGGRGITVCNEWLESFQCFLNEMGKKPSKKHTLERIDNSKGYSKDNCKWATWEEQQNNRRTNKVIDFNGKSLTVIQWSRELGMNYPKLLSRINKNWPIEKAFSQ